MFSKRISGDVLVLVLLLVRLRLDSDISQNDMFLREPESREVLLGSSSAYTQTNFHSPYSDHRYPHPKTMQFDELDEVSILFNRLNYFNSVRVRRSNLIAVYGVEDASQPFETKNSNNDGARDSSGDPNLPTGSEGDLNSGLSIETEAVNFLEGLDLSPEDMDLIEILWKQDIDIGVSREAYDSRPCVDIEKLKDIELSESLQELYVHEDIKGCKENDPVPDPLVGVNYTVDSETGEYILDEMPPLRNDEIIEDQLFECESEALMGLTNDSYLPFDDGPQFHNLSGAFYASNFSELLPDGLSDSDYLLSQIEDLEKEIVQFESLNRTNENSLSPGEMYPNVDDCWPDTTAMLPLLALGSTNQGSFAPLSPRPGHGYLNLGASSGIPLSSNLQNRSSDSFIGILQNTTLEAPSTDETFQTIPSSIGPSSVGYAVAESMATLTNDTDPLPTSHTVNTACNPDFPDLLYSNQSLAVPHNELLISDLLLDEDFQLVAPHSNGHHNQSMSNEDHMDTSSDSVSLTSGQGPSASDYQDWIDSCSESSSHHGEREDLTRHNRLGRGAQASGILNHPQNFELSSNRIVPKRQKHVGNANERGSRGYSESSFDHDSPNDPHYVFLKKPLINLPESSPVSSSCVPLMRKFDFTIPRASGPSNNDFLLHNHSYHLPCVSDNSRYKPVMRDKSKSSSDEDSSNKDEKKAKELKLPLSIDDIINLAIDEYNERLSKYELTEAQLTLIRDIRRRGKNKVAAQNCRKRKMDQISSLQQDLGTLQDERFQLKSKKSTLLQQKHHLEDKYAQLYQLVLRSANSKPPGCSNDLPVHRRNEMTIPSTSDAQMSDDDSDLSRGARTKRKLKK